MRDLVEREIVREKMLKYGFTAPDMTVHEFIEDELPPVTQSRHVNCEIAEHDGNGCLGYSHYGDDFPIEECLHCPKYTSYEEE